MAACTREDESKELPQWRAKAASNTQPRYNICPTTEH
jgi:hypothetical protein